MELEPTVFIVDDDPAMLDSLRWLVESAELKVETFTSAQAFLMVYSIERLGPTLTVDRDCEIGAVFRFRLPTISRSE